MAETKSKQSVLQLMHRLGMPQDRIDDANRTLPDRVDIDRDGNALAKFGLTVDSIWNTLGAEY